VNLPNALTVGRIAITPLIAVLAFVGTWEWRLLAFVVYIAAAVSDYYDGALARRRNQITPLGQLLDPLADKLLLVGTVVPMFLLIGSGAAWSFWSPLAGIAAAVPGPVLVGDGIERFPFFTPIGLIGLPWWILAVIFGRELVMTIFRQVAARRGVIIAAIGPAKWKTGFQSTWVGATFFWFFAATIAEHYGWTSSAWRVFAHFNGIVGVLTMIGATGLTLYSLALYFHRFGYVLVGGSRMRAR